MDPDELRARQLLHTMQEHLRSDPYDALSLTSSEPAEVRRAFLRLTKIYHPARFARMSVDIQRLANEVFLALRATHDTLSRQQVKAPGARQTGGIPILRPQPAASRPGTGPIPVLRPPGAAPAGPPARPTPMPTRPTPAPPSRPTPYPTSPQSTRPGANPSTPARSPSGAYPVTSSQTGTGGYQPLQRPGAPSAQGSQAMRPQPPSRTPSSSPPPPSIQSSTRPSGATPAITAGDAELAAIQELLVEGRLSDARMKLETLVARQPGVPRIQALIHYTKGREAQLARRIDEARVELMDALQLDPDLQLAKSALGELFTRRK